MIKISYNILKFTKITFLGKLTNSIAAFLSNKTYFFLNRFCCYVIYRSAHSEFTWFEALAV